MADKDELDAATAEAMRQLRRQGLGRVSATAETVHRLGTIMADVLADDPKSAH